MKNILVMLGVAILIIGITAWAVKQRDSLNRDIYLESGRKVMSVQLDDNYRMFVATRAIRPDESPEIIRVYRYPNKSCWNIHESK